MKSYLLKGFSLIELMIVVAIIGILSAIALPIYQDYITRAQVTEAIIFGASFKTNISEFFQTYGVMPTNNQEAGIEDLTHPTSKITAVSYQPQGNSGAIAVTLNASTISGIDSDASIEWIGTGNLNTGIVEWTCGPGQNNGLANKFLPASCRN